MTATTLPRRAALALFALLGLALPVQADFTFIHMTDVHVGATDAPNSRTAIDASLFREISALNPKPAFVMNTGDVCEIGTDEEYAFHQKAVKENLTVPYYAAPGNHDVRWNPRGKEGYTLGTKQPLYQSWDYEGVHFVLLDSTVLLQHWGHFDQEQLDWLAKDLKKTGTKKPVIIGFHHPIFREGAQVDNGQALWKVLEPYNVRLFVIGHGHSNIQWNINGVPAIMSQGLYQGSYNVVRVSKDRLEVFRRTEERQDQKRPFLTVPLARPAAPSRRVDVRVEGGKGVITVPQGDIPTDATASYSFGNGKPLPLEKNATGWTGTFATEEMTPGNTEVIVTVTMADGRAYQIPTPVKLSGTNAIQPAWTVNVGGAVQGKLTRYKNLLLVPSMGGSLVALDAVSGKTKWKVATGGSIFSAPLGIDDVVYFGSADHYVYAVKASDGKLLWKTPTEGAVFGGASKAGNIICIASVDRKIYGLDATTGKVVWTTQGEGMYQSQAITDGERFFVGGWDNFFRCLDVRTGKELWKQKFGRSFYFAPAIGSPTIGDGKAFVTSNDGILHAVEIATGKLLWESPAHSMGYSGPLYKDGIIYNASLTGAGNVYAFDAQTGMQKWVVPTGSVIYDSSCAFGGGNLFVGCVDGTFSAVRIADGKVAWQYRLAPGHLLASPATDEQRVYIGSMSGEVSAFPLNLVPASGTR